MKLRLPQFPSRHFAFLSFFSPDLELAFRGFMGVDEVFSPKGAVEASPSFWEDGILLPVFFFLELLLNRSSP
jgi:hypothetical protein